MRVTHVVDDGILHVLLYMCGLRAQLRHPVDDVGDQMETRGFIQHRQFERCIDVALFLITTHVQVVMSLESVRELMDEPRITMEIKNDRLVRSEQAVEFTFRRPVRMLRWRLRPMPPW